MSDLQERIARTLAGSYAKSLGFGTGIPTREDMHAAKSVVEALGLTEEYAIAAHGIMLMDATDSKNEAESWLEGDGPAVVVSRVVGGWREA